MSTHHEQPDPDQISVEAERDRLQELQARQEIILKREGIFVKSLALLFQGHHEQQHAFESGKRPSAPRWQPPEADGSDGTRLSVALGETRSAEAKAHTIQLLNVLFKVPSPEYPDFWRTHVVTVGQRYEDIGLVLPIRTFTDENVGVVSGLLDDVREVQARGELPHLRRSLAEIGPIR